MTSIPDLYTAFIVRFSELAPAGLDVISAALSDAQLQIDQTVWGTTADLGTMYLAADMIALSPGGNPMRLAGEKGRTTYRVFYDALVKQVAAKGRPSP